MQAAIKHLVFAFLVCSFSSAQDCSRKDINFENIQKSGLAETSKTGDVVRVNCATGYVGFLKLSCANGEWKKDGGRECKKRPCGHPGDTSNGDFKLIGETEFVFGARVEYTCRTGYVMASRVNVRNCRSQGWDNAVPVCEVVKCPIIRTSEELIATGNTEEASFEDVIHFECASRHLMLEGPEDIHCTEHATWSAPVPKCIEIRCKPPPISRGKISDFQREYKENEQLKYTCDEGYKPRHGTPKCLRSGWSITPDCEEITCLLGDTTHGIISTSPRGKNVFKAGESVEITCSEKYWLIRTKETSKRIRCLDNGEWQQPPVCEEITCDVPYADHVYYPHSYFGRDRRLGVRNSYRCESGYKETASEATCTKNGWDPKPLCTEIGCTAPKIEYAQMLEEPQDFYKPYARIKFRCLSGHEFFISCNWEEGWDYIYRCPVSTSGCQQPNDKINNGFIKHQTLKQTYKKEDAVIYECSEGFIFKSKNIATCDGPGWTYPQCIPKPDTCVTFRLENGEIQINPKGKDSPGSHTVYYTCDKNYKTFDHTLWGETSCHQGAWTYKPQCIHKDQCGRFPKIPHGTTINVDTGYDNKLVVAFECDAGYKPDPPNIKCQNGTWTTTECKIDRCGPPPRVENAVIQSYTVESHQSVVTYKCREHFVPTKRPEILCIGKWERSGQLKCELSPSTCVRPTNYITNGYVKEPQKIKNYYRSPDTVEYECSEGFMFEEENSAACIGQNWTYPQCIPSACRHPQNIDNGVTKDLQKLKQYYSKGDTVEYECSEGFRFKGVNSSICNGENWIYPQCIRAPSGPDQPGTEKQPGTTECGPSPWIENAIYDSKTRHGEGEKVTYECPAYYIREGDEFLTCSQGKWAGNVKCIEPCTVDVKVQDANHIELKHGGRLKIYSMHGDHVTFRCQLGYTHNEKVPLRQQCENGRMTLPVCEKL